MTGFGKLVCYKVLPFVMDLKRDNIESGEGSHSTILVLSPLMSLMMDQVTSLRECDVMATIVTGHPAVSTDSAVSTALVSHQS